MISDQDKNLYVQNISQWGITPQQVGLSSFEQIFNVPGLAEKIGNLSYDTEEKYGSYDDGRQEFASKFKNYIADSGNVAKEYLNNKAWLYGYHQRNFPNDTPFIDSLKQDIVSASKWLSNNNILSPENIQKEIYSNAGTGYNRSSSAVHDESSSFWNVALPIVMSLALPTGVGTALSAANAVAQGADIKDILKSAVINQGLSSLGSAIMAPEVDLNAATSDFQNVYGGNLPIEDVAAAFEPVVPEAVTVGSAMPAPDIVPTPLPAIEPSVVQPDYFSADAGPLADTTIDNAFVQDMSQGIEPVVPPENPFLAGMEETTATEGAGVAGAENPTGTYTGGANYLSGMEETAATEGAGVAGAENPTGATTVLPGETPSLTPKQAYQLLRLGAGLFGGGGALAAAARGLTGGAGALGGLMGPSMSSIQAPTPFTGTYSGMNPYDAAYFQQVQQNYNRLFPTTPTNVAGPLESWYQTKYVPDTNISNKLFGV